MVYDYIVENYKNGDPIFLSELPYKSKDYLRQEMKQLTDEGKLERVYNGVYYLSYPTILGTKGKMSIERYIDKKYLNTGGKASGYVTGLQLANRCGFTTQNSSCYEICSNEATTKQRKLNIDGNTIIIYKPVAEITQENRTALQFLDLMSGIDRYSELSGEEYKEKLKKYVETNKVDFDQVKKYLPLYQDRTYRNLYEGGLMNELV